MMWTSEHDTLLCREILVEEPFRFKLGTRERGNCWEKGANNLNKVGNPRFWVDQRAVRDRVLKLERGFKRKIVEEERASGISPPEPTEVETAIREIIERGEEAQNAVARGEQNAVEREWETAESVRKRSMERLAETREKESQGCGKKRRKHDGDREAIDYFRGKYDREFNFKREELELRKREMEMKEQEKERQWEITKRETDMKEKETERQWEIKKREFEMKEREWEARSKRERE